jgi:hypothetical protein
MTRHLPSHPKNPGYVTLSAAKGLESRFFAAMRLRMTASMAVLIFLFLAPALALAHGNMGPDEIGPPILTSSLLGFVGYWAVMLWPARKKEDDSGLQSDGHGGYDQGTERRTPRRTGRVKRPPRLRKIEGGSQIESDQAPRRRASDG